MNRSIIASVGKGGANKTSDVRVIQELLNTVAATDGGPLRKLALDGKYSDELVCDITRFQTTQHLTYKGQDIHDGRVDPGYPTIDRLNQFAARKEEDAKNVCICRLVKPVQTEQANDPHLLLGFGAPVGPNGVGAPPKKTLTNYERAIAWSNATQNSLGRLLSYHDAPANAKPRFPQADHDKAERHFHLRQLNDNNDRIRILRDVYGQFGGIIAVLSDVNSYFVRSLQADVEDPTGVFARAVIDGYHMDTSQQKITIYPIFDTCGNNCRAAMLVHECAHYVCGAKHYASEGEGPNAPGYPDKPNGKNTPDHPRNYVQLWPVEASRNACTYAAYAFHCYDGNDLRPGAYKISW